MVELTGGAVLRRMLREQRGLVLSSALLGMCWQACESLVPVAVGVVIDRAIDPGDLSAAGVALAGLAALFLVLSFSFRFASRLATAATEQTEHALRMALTRTVLDPHTVPDPGSRSGALLSVATSDAKRAALLATLLPRCASAIVSLLVAAAVLLTMSIPLGLLVLIGTPPLLWALHALGAPLERRAGTEQEHAAHAAALATDLVLGLRVLKGIGAERRAARRYHTVSRGALHATLRSASAESIYAGVTLLLTMLFLALVALVGGRLAAHGDISVGDLVAAVGLAQFLLGPLGGLAAAGTMIARARASAGRIATLLAAPRRGAGTATLDQPVRGELVLQRPGYTVELAAGEILGLVADTGEANAVIELLSRAGYDPECAVQLDGRALAELEPETAYGALLVARHDAVLFDEPASVAVRVRSSDDALINDALEAADADQVLAQLPDGGATRLGERASRLSGGQRQRLTLARALAADPPALVLHDPTTAVDAATEARIATGLRRLRAGRSTLVIATSPALLSACDRVLLVVDGQLRATGRHKVLAGDEPAYRELVF